MLGFTVRVLAIALALPLGFAIVGTSSCLAQFGGGPGGFGGGGGQRAGTGSAPSAAKAQPTAPPVLPGTKAAPEAAAPTASPADMSPSDSLFDAINRGDLAAARDAVNRGADLNGFNVLGLTPLELSVDLGRNNISFMLLSMRDEDAASRSTARRGGSIDGVDLGDTVPRDGTVSRVVSRPRLPSVSARVPEGPVVAAPRLYSGNGGAPIPAAGFVGFDAGRTVR